MSILCFSTFLGLVMAALAAKLHQQNKRTKFRFSLAFMDISFFFLNVLALIALGGGKHLEFSHITIFGLTLFMYFFRFNKWERKA
jgi:hypothetical protein